MSALSTTTTLPWLARKLVRYIQQDPAKAYSLDDLARVVGMSKFNFNRTFAKQIGMPPVRWLWTLRVAMAGEIIRLAPRMNLLDVAVMCGFSSASHFSRQFRLSFALTPSQYRAQCQTSGHRNLRAAYGTGTFRTAFHEASSPLVAASLEACL